MSQEETFGILGYAAALGLMWGYAAWIWLAGRKLGRSNSATDEHR